MGKEYPRTAAIDCHKIRSHFWGFSSLNSTSWMMNFGGVAHARLACNYQSIEIQTLENDAHNFSKPTPLKSFVCQHSSFNNLLEKSFCVVRKARTSKTSKIRFFCICNNRKNIIVAHKKIHFWKYPPSDLKVSLSLSLSTYQVYCDFVGFVWCSVILLSFWALVQL